MNCITKLYKTQIWKQKDTLRIFNDIRQMVMLTVYHLFTLPVYYFTVVTSKT